MSSTDFEILVVRSSRNDDCEYCERDVVVIILKTIDLISLFEKNST